jgi:hypothetical protein
MNMKKVFSMTMAFLFVFGIVLSTPANAGTDAKTKKIEEGRTYLKNNVKKITMKLEDLKKKESNVTGEEINKVIEKYYKDNPAPKGLDNIPVKDLFPEKAKKMAKSIKKDKTINLNEFMEEQKKNSGDTVITIKTPTGEMDVYVSVLGISTLEHKSEDTSLNTKRTISALAASETTFEKSTTGTAYSMAGYRQFSLTSVGQFYYTGSSVSPT